MSPEKNKTKKNKEKKTGKAKTTGGTLVAPKNLTCSYHP